ncbi:hypothetical protein AeRB84_006921 [Aphanomyces euteiches]|nr:hypothetical protein AeRB84_013467 [Aphanomyces euteiches]KAH9147084.1 hypothetical protein AeRB84_009218 [Aphanomyces euteiches]KAH9150201.1 hypothetical protein AeRB84_006921 [Aphanomyces euteiches]
MQRQRISLADKLEIKAEYNRNPEKTHEVLAEWAKEELKLTKRLDRSTISKILKSQVQDTFHLSRKANIPSKFPAMETELYEWIKVWEDLKIPLVDGKIILEKATQLLSKQGTTSSLSNGWLDRFKRRYNIKSRRLYGESASADVSVVESGRAEMLLRTQNFAKADIYNMDETSYFYCSVPTKCMSTKPFNGRKQNKKRITIAITTNASGTCKPPLLFVGPADRPRCFRGATPEELEVQYASSKKAWMTRSVFGSWVQNFNSEMCAEGRHVLLLLDNASSHQYEGELSNTSIAMLPPNTTSFLQPQDAGAEDLLQRVGKENITPLHAKKLFDVDVLEAMRWAQTAWQEVTQSTIENCWRHSAILDEELYELNNSINAIEL